MQDLLLEYAIPCARAGLQKLGIASTEKWFDIIQARVTSGRTGSDWILKFCQQYNDMKKLVQTYLDNAKENKPVHLWPDV